MEQRHVLIIEDDKAIAELERDYLEMSHYKVTLQHDGAKALADALANDYDLIVLDLMLPSMDGFEICQKIREKKETPILIVSARKEDIDKIKGFKLGADDYLTKPFSPSELVARVSGHIERYARLTQSGGRLQKKEIAVRGLLLQLDSRRVTLHGKEIILTAKEYDLLLFLAENPDRVYSKEALLDKVWGIDCFGDTATVTVHIGKIREKLEKDAERDQFIETIWGAGYRFKV